MRLNRSLWLNLVMAVGMLGFVAGCGTETPSKAPDKKGDAKKGEEHDHDHKPGEAHDHEAHAHGPNGGHVVEVGNEEYHIEWDHDDASGLVTIYLLDKELKNMPETDAAEIVIDSKVGEKVNSYTLPRVPSESETNKTSKFEITDKALLTSLMLTEGVDNTLKIKIGGKDFTAKIKHDASHDH